MASNELKLEVPGGFERFLYALGFLPDAESDFEKQFVDDTFSNIL